MLALATQDTKAGWASVVNTSTARVVRSANMNNARPTVGSSPTSAAGVGDHSGRNAGRCSSFWMALRFWGGVITPVSARMAPTIQPSETASFKDVAVQTSCED
jgi:hypothetical protein